LNKHPRNERLFLAVLLLLVVFAPLAAQPRTMGLMYYDSTQSYRGYTLFAPLDYNVVYLIDNEGRLVHSWNAPSKPGLSVYLLADGSLLHSGRDVNIRDWDNNELWAYNMHGDSWKRSHDLRQLPNGHIMSVVWRTRSVAEALAAGRNPALLDSTGLLSSCVYEVDTATNQIVWEWDAWDHLIQDFDSTKANYGVIRDHPELIDLNYGIGAERTPGNFMHFNAVDYNPDLDQVVASARIYSEGWVIDHSTTTDEARGHSGGRYGRGGDLLYRWGNPEAYGHAGADYHRLMYQHDVSWIPDSLPGGGHMMAFSNGDATRPWSEVAEWSAPMESLGFYALGADSIYGPEEPAWTYRDTIEFYSSHIGGAQRLPNGNTLICEGRWGTLFEVTPDSQVVWKYISPVDSNGPMTQGEPLTEQRNNVFRCYRYGPEYSGFAGRSLVPGDPIELPGQVAVAEPAALPRLAIDASHWVRNRATIVLSLAEPTDVELAVFDCRGAMATRLATGRLAAGEHRFTWNAAGAPAGVYICRLVACEVATGLKLLKIH
jgi:hypothetical protein